ncbi:hypothetical protein KR093_005595 [Drosophila rubida]|uniref:Uncharacterized protein n=1 Tax=Drosophila rubida TaxID=30044 RepID=A0AAD4KAB8_9MUSC|nr:hypothetical protein KR093_005595 [Drosophila rubida]
MMMNNLSSGCRWNTWKLLPRQGMLCWQMYRCSVMQSLKCIDNKLIMAGQDNGGITVPVVQRNAKSMVPQYRFGMWCKSMILPTTYLWTGLQPQRAYVTKPKNDHFDKFGRKIDAPSNEEEAKRKKPRAAKRSSSVTKLNFKTNLKTRTTEKSRNAAKQRTARSHKLLPIPRFLDPENRKRDYKKLENSHNLYMKPKCLLMGPPSQHIKRKLPIELMEESAIKKRSQLKQKPKDSRGSDLIKYKSEREDLKHLLADLLKKQPTKLLQSTNFEYVKNSPIFKLISHSAERRNTLRTGGFHKQLENPTFFKHPLGIQRGPKINVIRRTILSRPNESQLTKRTKSVLKTKLCLLLQDHKDQGDDDID